MPTFDELFESYSSQNPVDNSQVAPPKEKTSVSFDEMVKKYQNPFEGLSKQEAVKLAQEKGLAGPTPEQERRVKGSVIGGFLGAPKALLQAPKALLSQINALVTGENNLEENLSERPAAFLSALDKAADYLPDAAKIRENIVQEDPEWYENILMGAGAGAPFGVGGALLGAAGGGLEEVLEKTDASPRTKAASRLGLIAASGIKGKKGLQPKPGQKRLFNFLKKQGLEDSQIAPILEKPGQSQKFLSKLASKEGKTKVILESIGEGLGETLEEIQFEHPSSKTVLGSHESQLIENKLNKALEKLPSKRRGAIERDVSEFLNSPRAAEDAINLWRDINDTFGSKNKKIQPLKAPLLEALETIDPALAEDFQLANQAYSNYASVRKNLSPKELGYLGQLTGPSGFVVSMILGNPWSMLKKWGVKVGASQVAREMVLNPNLKNISQKMSYAINKKSAPMIGLQLQEMAQEVEKWDEEAAEEIRKINPKDFITPPSKPKRNRR